MPGRLPDSTLIEEGQGEKGAHIESFTGADHSYAMVYLPIGKTITVRGQHIHGKRLQIWWYNPRDASAQRAGILNRQNKLRFTPPSLGPENDWVLVIDDAFRHYAPPGCRPISKQ